VESELAVAERIAVFAHAGQFEESTGDPYICHVERVVNFVKGDEAKAVAWLHDVIEDSPLDAQDLLKYGISPAVIYAVVLLSREEEGEETYADYIRSIKNSGNPLALAVKIADMRDHLRPSCPERLRPRYEKAWQVLTGEPWR
jgi:(p)ppGpp synthase/HD superfamily hydrolase